MRQFEMTALQKSKLQKPEVMSQIMMNVGSKASFFAQKNTLFVHLNVSPNQSVWETVEAILKKYFGELELAGTSS